MFDYRPVERPYPGLRPFEPHEGEVFFGREGHTDRLLEILQRERFLAVIGPSGCGKSSLVRAGLLPALAAGRLGTGSHWRLALFRPGGQPLLALAQALIARHALGPELLVAQPGDSASGSQASAELETGRGPLTAATVEDATPDAALIAAELRYGPEGLERLLAQAEARRADKPPLNLLILADQFEEVFTYRDASLDPADAAAFVDLLIAARDRDAKPSTDGLGGIRLCVALTLRTDFLGHCVEFDELPEAINRAQYLTPRLKPEEMRAAIRGPARVFDGDVDPAFADEVIARVGGNSDQLPLLQHALARWWRAAERAKPAAPLVSAESTEDLGQVDEALDRHAEEIYENLPPEQQAAAEALFRAITAGREGAAAVRRPQRLSDIAAWTDVDASLLRSVVEKLADPEVSFLHYGRELNDASVIDLTHEALMRQWGLLKAWVDDELRRGLGYRRWQARAAEREQTPDFVLSGAELTRALDWWNPGNDEAGRWQPSLAWARRYSEAAGDESLQAEFERLRRFLVESRDRAQALREAEERRLEAEAQRARESELARTRLLFDALLTQASLLARTDDYVEAQRVLAVSAELDHDIEPERCHARNLLAGHVTLMGVAADRVYTDGGKPLAALSGGVAVSPDGRYLAAAGERATLVLFDAASGALLRRLEGHDLASSSTGDVRAIAFDPTGRSLFSGGDDGRVIRWSVPAGEKLGGWQTGGAVWGLAVRPGGKQLATGDDHGVITLWSLSDGEKLTVLEGHTGAITDSTRSLAYSPDGKSLASTSYDRTARVWDLATGKAKQVLESHNERAEGVDFSPDGQRLASSSFDHRIMLWDVSSGEPLRVLTGHTNIVFGLRFSKDGATLYSASRDNTLRAWDVVSGTTSAVFQGHESGLWSVDLSPDGSQAYTAANDGTVRRWPLHPPERRSWIWDTEDRQAATSAAIAPEGHWVAVGLSGGRLLLYALPEGKLVGDIKDAHKADVNRIAFSPDGLSFATVSDDQTAKLWTVTESAAGIPRLAPIHTLTDHEAAVTAVVFSPDGRRLATAGYDGKIGLFDAANGQGRTQVAHEGQALSVAFDPSGQWLLSAGRDDRTLRVWQTADLDQPPRELARTQDMPIWASIAPDGRNAAVVGRDLPVTLLDLQDTEAAPVRLVGHEQTVYRAIYSPDSRQLATVSSDMTLRLWDLSEKRLLFTQRLPAVRPSGQQGPLWDFDFRCVMETGACWIVVPLTMGRVVVYRFPYEQFPTELLRP